MDVLVHQHDKYQERAITTKIYSPDVAIPYVLLGIIGEVGELDDALNADSAIDVKKEAGDVYWYLAAWASETNQKLGALIPTYFEEDRQNKSGLNVSSIMKGMNKASRRMAELGKKYLRDQHPKPIGEYKHYAELNQIVTKIALGLIWISNNMLQEPISVVLDYNIEKLQSRKDRGKLSGSGDNR